REHEPLRVRGGSSHDEILVAGVPAEEVELQELPRARLPGALNNLAGSYSPALNREVSNDGNEICAHDPALLKLVLECHCESACCSRSLSTFVCCPFGCEWSFSNHDNAPEADQIVSAARVGRNSDGEPRALGNHPVLTLMMPNRLPGDR